MAPGNTEDFIKALGINKARAARGYTNYINKKSSSPGQKIVSPRAIDRDVIRNWLASGVGFGVLLCQRTRRRQYKGNTYNEC